MKSLYVFTFILVHIHFTETSSKKKPNRAKSWTWENEALEIRVLDWNDWYDSLLRRWNTFSRVSIGTFTVILYLPILFLFPIHYNVNCIEILSISKCTVDVLQGKIQLETKLPTMNMLHFSASFKHSTL